MLIQFSLVTMSILQRLSIMNQSSSAENSHHRPSQFSSKSFVLIQ